MAKTHLVFIVFLIAFSLFACQKLFSNKFYTSHDGQGHVIRMIEFDQSFKDGQIPVRLAKRINYGLGNYFFNFNYPFIYYLGELLHGLGLSFVNAFKTIMIASIIIGAVSFYSFALFYFEPLAAFVGSCFFIFAPYRFLNMYVRGNVAESFGLALVPLLFFSVELVLRQKKWASVVFLGALSVLILSHNITVVITIILAVVYFSLRVWSLPNRETVTKRFLFILVCSALLTAFFWIPVLFESQFVKLSELSFDYPQFFPSVGELVYSPWGFGAFVSGKSVGKMSPQIGVVHQIVFVITLMIYITRVVRTKKFLEKDGVLLFFIFISILSGFLASPFSKFLWDFFEPLRFVQIPWRFVGYIVFGSSILAGYLINTIEGVGKKIFLSIILLAILFYVNRNHIRVNQYVDFQNPFPKDEPYADSTTSKAEHMPKWAPLIFTSPNKNGDVIPKNAGTSIRTVWKSNYHRFVVNLNRDADFRDNTSYYPGWEVTADDKPVLTDYKNDEYGRLRFHVAKGAHVVESFFRETPLRRLADFISVVSFGSIIIFIVMRKLFVK